MDILSDVNIKGQTTLGGPLYVSNSTNYYGEIVMNGETLSIGGKNGEKYNWCISANFGSFEIDANSIILKSNGVYFESKKTGFSREIVPYFKQITIPENCSKFFITDTNISIEDESNIYKYFSYPIVMAYQCGKRVEIDVELANNERSTEIIYGSISPQAEQRELSVVYLFSFKYPY